VQGERGAARLQTANTSECFRTSLYLFIYFFGFFPPTSFADSACENALSKQNVIRPQPSPLFHFGQLQKINIDKQTKYDIF